MNRFDLDQINFSGSAILSSSHFYEVPNPLLPSSIVPASWVLSSISSSISCSEQQLTAFSESITIRVWNTEITGSNLTIDSGSFSSRIYALENNSTSSYALTASYVEFNNISNKPTLISGSYQIASDISGSSNELSSSISNRVNILENTIQVSSSYALTASYVEFNSIVNKPTLISSSYQIAADISGSFGSTSSSINTTINNLSSSIDSTISLLSSSVSFRLNENEDLITTLTNLTSSYVVKNNPINSTQIINGSLRLIGNLIAENYIISSSVTHMTTSFSSGSTIFGDTLDDKHQFTGSVDITGSLTINGQSYLTSSYVDYNNIADKPTLISSSYQIHTDISGAFNDYSSSINNTINTFSSSIQNRVFTRVSGSGVGVVSIDDINTSSYDAGHWRYVISSGSNKRSGVVMGTWYQNNVESVDYSTNDIGDTSDAVLVIENSIVGVKLSLYSTYSWVVKTNRELI